MDNCNIYYKQLANYKKKQFLSCFTKVFSNRELKNYGWGCSDRTIAKARSHFVEKGCGVVPTNKNNYIKNNSTTANLPLFALSTKVTSLYLIPIWSNCLRGFCVVCAPT